jgi:hypothetical protein
MDDHEVRLSDFQAFAKILREQPPKPRDRLSLMEDTLAQALLLLGSMQGGGALRELQQQFMQQLQPLRPSVPVVSFLDTFSGNGELAQYLKNPDNFEYQPDASQEANNDALEVFRACSRNAGALNFYPYQSDDDLAQLNALFAELTTTAWAITPQHFNECKIQGGFGAAITQNGWMEHLEEFGSGFYEDRTRPFNPDGSVPWVLFLKKQLIGKTTMATVVMVMVQRYPPQVFVRHHYEDSWWAWDGKTLLPDMVHEICEQYAWAKMLSHPTPSGSAWFDGALKRICEISRSYGWQHNVLPSQTFFKHEPSGNDSLYADFMHVEGSCRLTVRTEHVWMVVYGTNDKIGGWNFTVRFNRPQVKESLITIPVEQDALTITQQRVLIQRAFRALALKTDAIEYEQKKTHQEKESA